MIDKALGKLLVTGQFINDAELENFVKDAEEKKETLLSTIVKGKKLSFSKVAYFLASKFQIPYIDISKYNIEMLPKDLDIR